MADNSIKPERAGLPDALAQRLQELVEGLVSQRNVYHALLAIESSDRSFRWSGTAGVANPEGKAMRPATPFHIASIDKMLTASIILKLYESGHIGLEKPIGAYLQPGLIRGLHRMDGVDYTDRITVRNLLSHTSGLADCLEDRPKEKGGRSLMDRLFTEGDMSWTIDDLMDIVRDQLTPHFPPQPASAKRQKVRYCDSNYQLLIAIIEAVTAEPLHVVLDDMLFSPLDMRQTWLYGYSQPQDPVPEAAAIWFENQPLELPLALRSFPSVYSTAENMLRFMRGLMQGEIFEDPGTLSAMKQRWNRFGFPLDPAALRAPSWPIEYGSGMMRFRLPRLFTAFQPVPEVIGHTGSTGSWLFYCPKLDVSIVGTVNQATAGAAPYRLIPRLLQLFETTDGSILNTR